MFKKKNHLCFITESRKYNLLQKEKKTVYYIHCYCYIIYTNYIIQSFCVNLEYERIDQMNSFEIQCIL